MLFEGLDLEELSRLVGDEAVLCEDVVVGGDGWLSFRSFWEERARLRERGRRRKRQRSKASEMKPPKRLFFPSSLSLSIKEPLTVLPELLADLYEVRAPDDADLDVL